MKPRTLIVLVALVFGVYRGVQKAGAAVDSTMAAGRSEAQASTDVSGTRQDVVIDLDLAYKDTKTVATNKFDMLNAGMLNLRGSVTNRGPAARSIEVRVNWKDANYSSSEETAVVDLGPFEAGETRSFDESFTNSLGTPDKDGSRNYALKYQVTLERVVPR